MMIDGPSDKAGHKGRLGPTAHCLLAVNTNQLDIIIVQHFPWPELVKRERGAGAHTRST